PPPPCTTLSPYTTLFRSPDPGIEIEQAKRLGITRAPIILRQKAVKHRPGGRYAGEQRRARLQLEVVRRTEDGAGGSALDTDDSLDRKSTRLNSSHVATSY